MGKSPSEYLGLTLSDRGKRAFDFTVMRGHDMYVTKNHKIAMKMVEPGDDFGIARVLVTLQAILRGNG